MGKHVKYASGREYYVAQIPIAIRTEDELYIAAKEIAERDGKGIDEVLFEASVGLNSLLRRNIRKN